MPTLVLDECDADPISVFHALGSAEGSVLWEQPGARSPALIGLDPVAVATARGGQLSWTGSPVQLGWTGEPVGNGATVAGVLRTIPNGIPAMCVLGGDALRDPPAPAAELPEAVLVFPSTLIAFAPGRLRLVAPTQDRLDQLAEQLTRVLPLRPIDPAEVPVSEPSFDSDIPDDRYERMIGAVHQQITAGRARQVTISRRFAVPAVADPLAAYRVLRVINPSPYHFLLRLPGVTLVGASPQGLVRVHGRQVTVPVIAGTRPGGADPAADAALAAELLADPKERDEHAMLVELARADLAGVADPGTVRVADGFPAVSHYARVMHLVSEVTGELAPGADPVDALAAVFPSGTVTGTPRDAALRIIGEIEHRPRGLYGGAIGLRDAAGGLDLCLGIRTLHFHGGMAYCQAGAGVVAGSVPDREVQESRDKASAQFAALAAAAHFS